MSFGFEVRGPDGSVILDTTTWGWQFIATINLTELRRNFTASNGIHYGETTAGSIVFDGQNGRPYVPAGSELYAINVMNENAHPHMMWNIFYYETSGAYRKLRWSSIRLKFAEEDNTSYNSDRPYRTTIYVFAR